MQDGTKHNVAASEPSAAMVVHQAAPAALSGRAQARHLVTLMVLLLAAAALTARVAGGPGYDGWLMGALAIAAADLAFRLFFRPRLQQPGTSSLEATSVSLPQPEEAAPSPAAQIPDESDREAQNVKRVPEVFLDAVTDGFCGVDLQGLVNYLNPAAVRMLGAEGQHLTGKPLHEFLHGLAPASHCCGEDCPMLRVTDLRMAAAGEDVVFRAGGDSFPVEYVLTPILLRDEYAGAVFSFRDITQRYELDRLKDEFISTVSHELRTPLTSIRGAIGLLSSGILGELNEKAANLLRIALTNSDRLVRLINDILDLERIQSGREPIIFRPVQLNEIVRQAIDGMGPVAEEARVKLQHDSTQVEIEADPDRLLQVLTNLLSNAVKFSEPGSSVSITLRPAERGVTLSVIDNGRGIPNDMLEVIFGRFQQVDASDSRQKGGSGLGLAICRTIILQHSGRIWAERNPVCGSTFRVYLPYHPIAIDSPYSHDDAAIARCARETVTHGS
jgi:PAS domain S-box-containing protein